MKLTQTTRFKSTINVSVDYDPKDYLKCLSEVEVACAIYSDLGMKTQEILKGINVDVRDEHSKINAESLEEFLNEWKKLKYARKD